MQSKDEGGSLVGVVSCGVTGMTSAFTPTFVKGHVKDMRQGSMETISHVVGKITAVVDATTIPIADGLGYCDVGVVDSFEGHTIPQAVLFVSTCLVRLEDWLHEFVRDVVSLGPFRSHLRRGISGGVGG
jgi:hypothetical protein